MKKKKQEKLATVVLVKNLDKGMNIRVDRLEHTMEDGFIHLSSLIRGMNARFNRIDTAMDAFIKRTETNEHEIKFLGHQHDDLAKYCTVKIGYPTYGRNL